MDIFCREVKPYENLTMRQIQFWLRIMKEHSLFMKLGFSCEDTNLIEEADCFYKLFENLQRSSQKICKEGDFRSFVNEVMVAVKQIFAFKRHVLHLLIECRIGGANYPLLIDHISREALYFLKLLEKINDGDMKYPVDSIVSDNVFWLRIMGDHAKFVAGLLDPSERGFIAQANDFTVKFEQLQLHARDLDSMLWHFHPTNDLVRFEGDVTEATKLIRDFKEAARDLIQSCRIVSLIPPLLADHVLREAEHFLEILEEIKEDLAATDEGCSPIITCEY